MKLEWGSLRQVEFLKAGLVDLRFQGRTYTQVPLRFAGKGAKLLVRTTPRQSSVDYRNYNWNRPHQQQMGEITDLLQRLAFNKFLFRRVRLSVRSARTTYHLNIQRTRENWRRRWWRVLRQGEFFRCAITVALIAFPVVRVWGRRPRKMNTGE